MDTEARKASRASLQFKHVVLAALGMAFALALALAPGAAYAAESSSAADDTATEAETEADAATDISSAVLALSQSTYTYSGAACEPAVTITLDDTALAADTDYTLAYTSNTDAGTATVTATGTGSYTGTVSAAFTIKAASISDATVKLSKTSYTYDTTEKTPGTTVTLSGTKLVKGTDYTVSYSDNKKIGTAKVKVKGTGNYSGSVTKTFKILPATVSVKSVSWSSLGKLKVTWTKVSGSVTKYQVRYRTKGSSSWTIVNVSSSKSSYTIKNLTSAKKYQVQVRAYKTVSEVKYRGAWSSTKTVASQYDRTIKVKGSKKTLHHTAGTWSKKNGYKYYTISSTGKKAKSTFLNIKGEIYYFNSKGQMVKGWYSLRGSYYYFDRSSGKMASDTTVDKVKLGAYGTASTSGTAKTRIKVMISARKFMEEYSSASDSKSTRLKACFKALFQYPYKQYRKLQSYYKTSTEWELLFANDIFVNGKGCCVSTSCALAFIAHEIGYTDVYIGHDSGHAWVMIDGYVYDNLFAEARGWSGNYKGNKSGDYRTNPPYKYYLFD